SVCESPKAVADRNCTPRSNAGAQISETVAGGAVPTVSWISPATPPVSATPPTELRAILVIGRIPVITLTNYELPEPSDLFQLFLVLFSSPVARRSAAWTVPSSERAHGWRLPDPTGSASRSARPFQAGSTGAPARPVRPWEVAAPIP